MHRWQLVLESDQHCAYDRSRRDTGRHLLPMHRRCLGELLHPAHLSAPGAGLRSRRQCHTYAIAAARWLLRNVTSATALSRSAAKVPPFSGTPTGPWVPTMNGPPALMMRKLAP